MTQNGLKNNLTVIIAALNDHASFLDCLDGLRNWPVRIIIVSKQATDIENIVITEGYEWVRFDSSCTLSLWDKGLERSVTPWNLLIRSNEVVSGRLKKTIEKRISQSCSKPVLYLPQLKIIFLKKVLKYPLIWSGEPFSGLLYSPVLKSNLSTIMKGSLEGELICLRDSSVSIACSTILNIAKSRCARQRIENPSLSRFQLVVKTFKTAWFTLFKDIFHRQSLREGFEGLVFCVLDFYACFLEGVLCYEERIRRGGQIADHIHSIKKILIIKAMGIGDVVMATPVFRNLKVLMPHVFLSVLVPEPVDSILEESPYIDELNSLPKGLTSSNFEPMIGALIDEMNREKFDLIINLQSKNISSLILKKVHGRWKINRSYYYRDKRTDVIVGCETLNRSGIERDLDCLRSIGLEPKDKYTEVFIKNNNLDKAEKFFTNNSLDLEKKTIFIHPVASVEIREWGINKFSQLCRVLVVDYGFQVIANVSKSEMDKVKPIIDIVPEVVVFSGSVRDMLGVIKKCNLLIGNDSGPSHISVALKVPTIVLNGPSSASLYRDADVYNDQHFVFNKDVPCRDLFQTQCYSYVDPETNTPICKDHICLEFSVDEVVAKAIELIQ